MDTLAMIDDQPVTSRDLFERLQLMPFEGRIGNVDIETAKKRAVASIVAERLLASTIDDAPATERWRMGSMRSVLERLFVRDALFLDEVRAKARVTEADVSAALARYGVKRRIAVARLTDTSSASSLRLRWEQARDRGDAGPSLVRLLPSPPDTVAITFGAIDQPLEDAAFALRRPLDLSVPVVSSLFGPVAVAYVDEHADAAAQRLSMSDRRAAVRKVLQERRETERVRIFTDSLLRGHTMTLDSVLATSIAVRMRQMMLEDTLARSVPGGWRPMPEDVYRLMRERSEALTRSFVRGSFGEVPLGVFLESLLHYDFVIPSLRPASFAVSFAHIVRTVVEAEVVALEAYRRGLQHRAEVRRDIALWMAHWRARWAEYAIAETVSIRKADAVFSLWRYHTSLAENSCVLDVREILRPDSISSERIAQELRRGAPFDSLARQWSTHAAWRSNGGRSGRFRFREHPDVASRVMDLEIGEWKGPVRTSGGFSLIQLLERSWDSSRETVDSLLEREARRVRLARQQAAVDAAVADLASQRRVWIDEDRIKGVEIQPVNMITRRIIGFGGRINAAPVLSPNWGWVDRWKQGRVAVP
jgi:hypothetical protein